MIKKEKFKNTQIQHLAYLSLIQLFVNTYNGTPLSFLWQKGERLIIQIWQ